MTKKEKEMLRGLEPFLDNLRKSGHLDASNEEVMKEVSRIAALDGKEIEVGHLGDAIHSFTNKYDDIEEYFKRYDPDFIHREIFNKDYLERVINYKYKYWENAQKILDEINKMIDFLKETEDTGIAQICFSEIFKKNGVKGIQKFIELYKNSKVEDIMDKIRFAYLDALDHFKN